MKVGYQGVKGSYSEQALKKYFSELDEKYESFSDIYEKSVDKFEDVFKGVVAGNFRYGVLPIENSSTGAIFDVYDLLKVYKCKIVGETYISVRHHLMGIKGSTIEDIKEVYSHPQGFEQSKGYLARFEGWKLIPYYNTAMSAAYVANNQDKRLGAIASSRAAEIYDLEVLAEEINCSNYNTTRFVIIALEEQPTKGEKISLIFSTKHQAGALFDALRYLAEEKINMVKIESRPIKDRPFEYLFYIDFEGDLEDNNIRRAIKKMKENCSYFKLLGNYTKGERNG